jgi:hypothetical protein
VQHESVNTLRFQSPAKGQHQGDPTPSVPRAFMHDWETLRRFNKTAEKWRDLAEKRRLYFEDLHQSGRWKYYYTEALFYRRLGKSTELVELWRPVLKDQPAEPPPTPKTASPRPDAMPKGEAIKRPLRPAR